jgi:hypothetical protein
VRSLHSDQLCAILQNAQTKGDILPEKSSLEVKGHLFTVSAFDGDHREGNTGVSNVGVEHSFQAADVADLTLIHRANPFFDGHDLSEVKLRILCEIGLLDSLNFIIEILDLICGCLVETFIE